MPGLLGGIANAVAKGAVAYGDQSQINDRDLILEKARQAALARQDRMDAVAEDERQRAHEQKRIETVMRGYSRGATSIVTDAAPAVEKARSASVADALSNAGSAEIGAGAAPVHSPLTDAVTPGALGSVPTLKVTETPESFTDPALAKEAERAQQQIARRKSTLSAVNDRLPTKHPRKLSPEQVDAVSANDKLYDEYMTQSVGLAPPRNIDPLSPDGIAAAVRRAAMERKNSGADSPALVSARKDAAETNTQEIRTEHRLDDLRRGEKTELQRAPTATDSATVHFKYAPRIKASEGNLARLRQRGDSIVTQAIPALQTGGAPSPGALTPLTPSVGRAAPVAPAARAPSAPVAHAPSVDPVAAAVQHIKGGVGTLAQLEASNKSPEFKAAVKQMLSGQPPRQPEVNP